jgi:hypothetical protein
MLSKDFKGVCSALLLKKAPEGSISQRRRQESLLCSKPTILKSGC